ncbi:Rv2175c family DNA-binding protein [Microbacterium sp. gxy059]|uniref:Rv2175c family DNA-binding protein n=1 Tax=Microbacterium sp. gxy059 TaxID=2957199 RepID=UPI003D97F369
MNPVPEIDWLTLPEVGEILGEKPGRVHRLLDERHLLALRRDGVLRVPASFLRDGRPLPALRGTIMVLQDAGFSDEEIVDWLFRVEESLGNAPIESLLAGRKAEVRRVAQTLA